MVPVPAPMGRRFQHQLAVSGFLLMACKGWAPRDPGSIGKLRWQTYPNGAAIGSHPKDQETFIGAKKGRLQAPRKWGESSIYG